MASENEASCESDPNFAVICGFLEKFSVTCGLANIDFVDLQEMLENTQEVSTELVELHVKLMRRARKSVSSNDRWERALIKTCHTFSSQDAWEIERFGYKKARISSKLRILKELLEMQFDYNQKFKNEINKISASELRTQPLGRDRLGRAYWYQCDESCQIRVYKDDPDDETWTLIAKDRPSLISLISQLGNGDTTKSSSEPVSNEDSNSVEVEKPTLDTGQGKSSSPKPTQPDTSDNMEEEKMDIDTECTETHKNIEENKLEETNSPNLPAKDAEKIVEEKVVEIEKKIEEKIDAVEVKPPEISQELIKEHPVVVEDKEEPVVNEKENPVVNEKENPVVDEKKDPVVNEKGNPVIDEKVDHVVDEKEDSLSENNENTIVDENGEKFPAVEEKLTPVEEEPCENALNLCSKDLSKTQESIEEKTGLDLSVKTGPSLRIKPITELMGEPQHSEMQKKEFMGIKGKYIRGDTVDKGLLYPNPTHLGKAVQSASYDAICYKRAMEDDIYSVPTSLKHPRYDKRGCIRPTLLANKKYIPYMDEDDDEDDDLDEDDIEDEIEEPLMLVQGEGSGFPNESANAELEENPIVGEEVEEAVLYVFGEGSGRDCKTGNECLKESQENKDKEAADHADTSAKSQQLSPSKSYKLGTIIDSKNDKLSPRNILRKSRWDVTDNPTENRKNTNENSLHDSKSDTSDVEVIEDLPINLSTSPQTFFFGNRSSFSPNSSPNKSASLSFGASTVSDNQGADSAASISSSKEDEEEEEEEEEEDEEEVEDSAATFNLDDKTDQNLVGSNPSQTKVPEENVDIENIDNNVDVSERLSVVDNERPGGSEKSASISEHEPVCCDKSATVTDVSDSKLSEIKEDVVEANSTNACVASDSVKGLAKLKDVPASKSVDDTHVGDFESAKSEENNSTIPSNDGFSDESLDVRIQIDTEKNQNLTAAVIPKDDALSSLEKAKDSVSESTSLDEPSQVIKSPEDTQPVTEKCHPTEVDEKVSSTVTETESTHTFEESESSKSSKDAAVLKESSKDVADNTDSRLEDQEVTNRLKSDLCESKVVDKINPISKEKERETNAEPADTPKKKEQITSLATDNTENNEDLSNAIDETSVGKNSKKATEEAVKIVNSNSKNVKLFNDGRDINDDHEKSAVKETKESNRSGADGKSNLLSKDKAPNEATGMKELSADASNVTTSTQENEIVENNNMEENNDLCSEVNKINEDTNVENTIKDKNEITTNDLKLDKVDSDKRLNEERLQIEENKSPTALSSAGIETESDLIDVTAKTNASGNNANNKNDEKSCKIDSKEKTEEIPLLRPKSRKNIEGNKEQTKEKTKPNRTASERKINNSLERKEPENLNIDTFEINNVETQSDKSSATKNDKRNKRKKEEIKEKSSEQPKDVINVAEKPKIQPPNKKETVNKISRHLDPVVVLSELNHKESLANVIENEDDAASKSGLEAIKAIKITSVQAKYNMPDKVNENKDKLYKPESSVTIQKNQIKAPPPQSLRFLRCRRPAQMLSVKSYATRNKNLVLRKETKPQPETNGKNIPKQKIVEVKPPKDLPNHIDEHLAIAKIEEQVENNVRRSTRRKPGDLIEKSPVIPHAKPKQRKILPSPQEIKRIEEVDVRHSKRLRLSNNQIPITNVETIDLTSESDSKHHLKRNPIAKRSEEVHLKGGLSIKPIYKEPEKSDKKAGKKNGPFLTCVNIKKLKENPIDHVDSPLSVGSSGGGDNSDVVIIEDDPLAVPDPYETSNAKPITLSSFQLDVDYPSPPPTIMTRSLRKRAITEPEVIVPTGGKRRKTKVKRQVDLQLRRSIEEQKKQEISSSDEEKKEVLPKRKPQLHKPKKQEAQIVVTPVVQPVKKPRAAKKKTLLGLDIPAAMEELDASLGNIRQSRRIAQLKIKEEAERRKTDDDITVTDHKETKKKSKKNIDKDYKAEKRKRPKPPTEEEVTVDIPVIEVEEKKKKLKRKRKHKDPRKIFDESNPWRSSSGSSSSNDDIEEEEEEIAEYSDAASPLFRSDHEFSPESDIEEAGEPQPLKRARTARKEDAIEDDVDEHACQKCGKSDHPEWILLCDTCDNGWHCSCLRPALFIIPEGDWFCPPCQHNSLVKQLEEKLGEYDKKLAKREIEVRRKERLAYVGISLANVLPIKDMDDRRKRRSGKDDEYEDDISQSEESYSSSESSSSSDSEPIYQLRLRRQAHSYRFNDYDDLINSAIQDEMEAVKVAGNQGRGKDISTIVNAENEEQEEIQSQELEPLPPVVPVESKELPPAVVPPEHNDSEEETIQPVKKLFGRKKHRKLNSLDVSSGDDPDSDEDFKGSSSGEEEDDDFEEDQGSDSSDAYGRRRRGLPVRRSTRARTSRYDKDFINDHSDDDIPRKKKSRSAWDDDSESEESDKSWGRSSKRKVKRPPVPRKKRSKKSKKHFDDSEDDRSKKKKRRIKYGGLDDDDDDDEIAARRTRGKKINYADVLASDSEDEVKKKAVPRIESDDDYVANEDQEEPDDEDYDKEKDVEKEKTPERNEIAEEKEKTPEREKSVPKEPEVPIPELQPTDVSTEELASDVPDPEPPPPQENFDLENLNSSIDDLPDDMPDDNDEDDSDLDPIDEMNKNLEEMDEAEMEKLMEEEEYANKQLQLMAMQLEKEKKRKEREAKKKEMAAAGIDTKWPKKRGRKNKLGDEPSASNVVQMATLQVGPDMQSNLELSEPPGVTIPIFSEIPPSSVDGSPKKRRGRGKGKKTLEKEQAAAAAASHTSSSSMPPSSISSEASDDQSHIPTTLDAVGTTNSNDLTLAATPVMHGAKLAIAAPPQPFSQTQPAPSVITRMMQTQSGQGNFSPIGMGHNYYADQPPAHAENSPTPPASNSQMSACVPLSASVNANNSGQMPPMSQQQYMQGSSPRGMSSSAYRQPPPTLNPYHRTSPAPPSRVRNSNPTPASSSIPPVYHTHHPLDPSPSGGGPISVSTGTINTPDRSSPVSMPPSSDSPISNKSENTPPPASYSRSQIRFGNVNTTTPPLASSPIRQQQNLLPPQHLQQQPPGPPRNNMPYHPANMPQNYYGGYMPGNMGSEESLTPTGYHYSDQFSETNSSQDLGKGYDEENSGEFGGLVSYFSSQREDDLDT